MIKIYSTLLLLSYLGAKLFLVGVYDLLNH